MRAWTLIAGAVTLVCFGGSARSAVRVLSLDQCADQYVLALSPRAGIVGLSNRVLNADSYLRALAPGLPRRRADSEAALASRPSVVVRYWGGEPRLLADLARRGARVVSIEDADDFPGVRRNVRAVAAALDRSPAGERMIERMDSRLAASAGAWRGQGALYLTSGGATAGRQTLIDAMLRAAGLVNLAGGTGYHAVSLERLVITPPVAIVQGFFDAMADIAQHWGFGRHRVLRRLAAGRALVSLPGSLLGCPAWFAANGVSDIALAARTHRPSF